jgi:hypothetical protein
MKQTLKIQALIYSAAYLLSSFIAWDLTWLPQKVIHYTVCAADRTPAERAITMLICLLIASQSLICSKADRDIAPIVSGIAAVLQLCLCGVLSEIN